MRTIPMALHNRSIILDLQVGLPKPFSRDARDFGMKT